MDKTSNIHVPVGKVSFDTEKLRQNMGSLMEAIMAAKPAGLKNIYIRRATLTSTMGPGVHMDVNLVTSMNADGS